MNSSIPYFILRRYWVGGLLVAVLFPHLALAEEKKPENSTVKGNQYLGTDLLEDIYSQGGDTTQVETPSVEETSNKGDQIIDPRLERTKDIEAYGTGLGIPTGLIKNDTPVEVTDDGKLKATHSSIHDKYPDNGDTSNPLPAQVSQRPLPPAELPEFPKQYAPDLIQVQEQLTMGEFANAQLTADAIIERDPEEPTGYWLSGFINNKAGNREEAIEVVRRGREIAPKHTGLQSLEKLFKRKASDMAEKEVDRRKNELLGNLRKDDASGVGPGFTLDDRRYQGVKMAGMVNPAMMGRGQYHKTPHSNRNAITPKGTIATKAGLNALRVGDNKAAVQKFTEAIRRDPKNAAAWRFRAMAFQQAGQHKQAVHDANRALQIDGADHWSYLVRAKALTDIGQMEAAQFDITAAMELKPQNADAYATRARMWHKSKQHDKELEDLREAANLDPAFQDLFRRAMKENEQIATGTDAPAKRERSRNLIYGAATFLALGLIGAALFRRSGQTTITRSASTGIAGFDIIRKLGQGGMGEVWEAQDRALERTVAIKKLVPEIASVPRERKRFLKEARTVAALKHPGIIEIHQVVENGDDLYLVFEHVDGVSLDGVLTEKQRLTLPESLEILRQTGEALDFAHGRGVIHQDLKPANIMVEGETVKVMDFGIARRAAETMGAVTRMEVVGTPSYMAPEQAQGESSPETDIYALGATLYEMLSGRRPFSGMMGDFSKLEKAYPPLSSVAQDLPPGVDAVIDRALDPDPKQRFHSGKEFFEALEAISGTPAPRA